MTTIGEIINIYIQILEKFRGYCPQEPKILVAISHAFPTTNDGIPCLNVNGDVIFADKIVRYGSPEYIRDVVNYEGLIMVDLILLTYEEISEFDEKEISEFDGKDENKDPPPVDQSAKIELQLETEITPEIKKKIIEKLLSEIKRLEIEIDPTFLEL
jgi:hypothetical protein